MDSIDFVSSLESTLRRYNSAKYHSNYQRHLSKQTSQQVIINFPFTTDKHHFSTNASHNEFFDECVHRLNPFQETLSIIKTTEADQGRLIAVKIRRVLDVLRNYVEHWPYLRSTSDQFPLDQSWRGGQQTYRVQVNNKTLEIKFHDNATKGNDHRSHKINPW